MLAGGCASTGELTAIDAPQEVRSFGSARTFYRIRGAKPDGIPVRLPVKREASAWLQPDSIRLVRRDEVSGEFEAVRGSHFDAGSGTVQAHLTRDGVYGVFGLSRIPAIRDFQFNFCGATRVPPAFSPGIMRRLCPVILCRDFDTGFWSRALSATSGAAITEQAAARRFGELCGACTGAFDAPRLPECGFPEPPSVAMCQPRRVPAFTVNGPEIIHTRAELQDQGLEFWPDGRIGVAVSEDGSMDFYAANSRHTAHTEGTLDRPADSVASAELAIDGLVIDDDGDEDFDEHVYEYAAGGPVYRVDATRVLMIYHAERHKADTSGERTHFFYAENGMAISRDGGETFEDLGIILRPQLSPGTFMSDAVDFNVTNGTGTYAVKDGYLYLFFPETRSPDRVRNNLCVARARIEDVVATALDGERPVFRKYYEGRFIEPGLGGRCTALEVTNPLNRDLSVSYNETLDRFVMVTAFTNFDRDAVDAGFERDTALQMATSPDGIRWSPRVTLHRSAGELFYPTIIDASGDPLRTGVEFHVYYTAQDDWQDRWSDARLERVTVTVDGRMTTMPYRWEFNEEGNPEGWFPRNGIGAFDVASGVLTATPTSSDPYIHSAFLGHCAENYSRIAVRMKTNEDSGPGDEAFGQLFFTSTRATQMGEPNSVTFELADDGSFHRYTVNMTGLPGWTGHLVQLRLDPTTSESAEVEIDYVRLLP